MTDSLYKSSVKSRSTHTNSDLQWEKRMHVCAPFSFYWFPTKSLNTFSDLLQIFKFWITAFAALLILLLWEHSKLWLPQLWFFCVQNCITYVFKNTYDIYKAYSKHYQIVPFSCFHDNLYVFHMGKCWQYDTSLMEQTVVSLYCLGIRNLHLHKNNSLHYFPGMIFH